MGIHAVIHGNLVILCTLHETNRHCHALSQCSTALPLSIPQSTCTGTSIASPCHVHAQLGHHFQSLCMLWVQLPWPRLQEHVTFALYRAVTTHIAHSFICQHEGKGVRTVTTQYRPSGRAEDQDAGAVWAAGAWGRQGPGQCDSQRRPRHQVRCCYFLYRIMIRYRIKMSYAYVVFFRQCAHKTSYLTYDMV